MDISGLESLIRNHPVLSLGIGAYTLCYVTALCSYFLDRRKIRKAEEKIRFCRVQLTEYIDYLGKNPDKLKKPFIKSFYDDCSKLLREA